MTVTATRPPGRHTPLRVLIVDDSIVARTVFQRMVSDMAGCDVVGVAGGVEQALAVLATTPTDVILLDVQMPGIDGLTALPAILAAGRGAHVVVVSAACADGAIATMQALALGASDTLLKPAAGEMAGGFADRLAERLYRLGPARPAARPAPLPAAVIPAVRTDPIGCIAIGASTGGLVALAELLGVLDPSCEAPMLVTQHLPAGFMGYFADQLSEMAGRPAMIAVQGQPVLPGQILVAPGTAHLALTGDGDTVRVRHDRAAAVSGCLPSVDPMLDAVAALYRERGIGVVLSGMGRDGAIGAARLAAAGGEILVQDAATATIWGMPGAVARAGIATATLPPAAIGRRISARHRSSPMAMPAPGTTAAAPTERSAATWK